MHILLLAAILIGVIFGPSIWVKRVMARYERPAERYPSTGYDLARHLLDKEGLNKVVVEVTDKGDHYDPQDKAVRLSPARYSGKSLTAVTVAAHEVGHALQDATEYAPLRARTRLVMATRSFERLGAGLMMTTPLIAILTRAPVMAGLMIVGGLMTLASATLVHLVTLPTEMDASFNRAMPLLQQQGILHEEDHRHARKILKAAAMTYVAASLVSLLNVARWWALIRR